MRYIFWIGDDVILSKEIKFELGIFIYKFEVCWYI